MCAVQAVDEGGKREIDIILLEGFSYIRHKRCQIYLCITDDDNKLVWVAQAERLGCDQYSEENYLPGELVLVSSSLALIILFSAIKEFDRVEPTLPR